jgi:SWI/SNF-related matrix-associated actin-dependent regulator of chromatin subfamily A-like protein 1
MFEDEGAQQDENNMLMSAYRITGLAKIEGACDFIDTLVDNGAKFLVFAHHLSMLDALEKYLIKNKVGNIRIDGKVPAERRHHLV